jgi:hypothetical protein
MLRTLQGIVLGLIAQGAGHLLLTWPLQAHFYPPNAWHILPFVVGGLVCGAYARRALPGLFVGLPYAGLMVFVDILVSPRLSAAAVVFMICGLVLGTATCGWLAMRRRHAVSAADAMREPMAEPNKQVPQEGHHERPIRSTGRSSGARPNRL